MPEFPFVGGSQAIRTAGSTGANSNAVVQLTASGTANAKGSVAELISSTEFDTAWMLVTILDASATTFYMVDIMIGAATEQVIIPDLFCAPRLAAAGWGPFLFPIFVPKGSRLSARCASATGSATLRVALHLIPPTLLSPGAGAPSWVSGYGATTGSQGTNLDGVTAETDSAYSQLTAATDRAHNWMVVSCQFGDQIATVNDYWKLTIGIGAATEQTLIELYASADSTADMSFPHVWSFPCSIPSGTRIAAKIRSSSASNGDRDAWVRVYGAG